MDHLTPELMRMFERQLIVAGGILAIYLGYRLFHLARISQESSGKIKTKLLVEGITGTNVDVKNGDVTIKGEVKNSTQITQVLEMVRSTEGVKNVSNQLTSKEK